MFPKIEEIKQRIELDLAYMRNLGFQTGEIEVEFRNYGITMRVVVRQGKPEYAKVIESPYNIFPSIDLK